MSEPFHVGPMIHLRTLEPFRELADAQLAAIAAEADEVVFQRGAWINPPGAPVEAVAVIIDGHARVVGPEGEELRGPGTLVGFPEVLVAEPVRHGARAETEVVALRLQTDALRDLAEQDFPTLVALLGHLAGAVADAGAPFPAIPPDGPAPTWADTRGEPDRVTRILALHRTGALSSDSMDALAELAGHARVARTAQDQVLCEPGEPAERFWIVASGTAELEGSGGRRLGPGAVIGLAETLASRAYVHRLCAQPGALLLAIDVDPFLDVLEDHFELAFALLASLGAHVIASRDPDSAPAPNRKTAEPTAPPGARTTT